MLLSKPRILEHLHHGNITISPFDLRNLQSSQYDVTLGRYCFRETRRSGAFYNPYDESQVQKKWELDTATRHEDLVLDRFGEPFKNIGMDEEIILIGPGETILAHTEEFIGGSCNFITSMMKARSSMGRSFIEVCKCAGMGDVGYFNRWTMEITNNSQFHTIPLVRKRRIAQILFFQVDPIEREDVYDKGGKYQASSSLAELEAAWTPEAMRPKQWKDREVRALVEDENHRFWTPHANRG